MVRGGGVEGLAGASPRAFSELSCRRLVRGGREEGGRAAHWGAEQREHEYQIRRSKEKADRLAAEEKAEAEKAAKAKAARAATVAAFEEEAREDLAKKVLEHIQGRQEAPLAWESGEEARAWLLGIGRAAAVHPRNGSCYP